MADRPDRLLREQTAAFLTAMLAATPHPDATDPDEILSKFAIISSERDELLARAMADPGASEDPAINALARELQNRDAAWIELLLKARTAVDDHLMRLYLSKPR